MNNQKLSILIVSFTIFIFAFVTGYLQISFLFYPFLFMFFYQRYIIVCTGGQTFLEGCSVHFLDDPLVNELFFFFFSCFWRKLCLVACVKRATESSGDLIRVVIRQLQQLRLPNFWLYLFLTAEMYRNLACIIQFCNLEIKKKKKNLWLILLAHPYLIHVALGITISKFH